MLDRIELPGPAMAPSASESPRSRDQRVLVKPTRTGTMAYRVLTGSCTMSLNFLERSAGIHTHLVFIAAAPS